MRQNNKRKKKPLLSLRNLLDLVQSVVYSQQSFDPGFVNSRIHGGALKIRPSMERPIVANSGHSTYKSLKMLKFMIIY